MSRITNRGVFNASLLPEAQPRWDLFSAGFGLQIVAVTALIVIPLLMPEKLNIVQRYWTTPIEAPPIVAWKPQPPPPVVKTVAVKEPVKPLPKPAPVPVPVAVELPKPKVYNPVVAAPVVKPVTRKNTSAPEMAEVAKVFPDQAPLSMGSSAVPNIKKPREAVQTGGFGDPDGVKDNGKTNKAANINVSGAYDMPAGPGSGNGTGGAKGAKGVTGSAGFGNGVAVGTPGGGPTALFRPADSPTNTPRQARRKPSRLPQLRTPRPCRFCTSRNRFIRPMVSPARSKAKCSCKSSLRHRVK